MRAEGEQPTSTVINVSHAEVHIHEDDGATATILAALARIEQQGRLSNVNEAESLVLLGEINGATQQISASEAASAESMEDAARDIAELLARETSVPPAVAAGLTAARDALTAAAATAKANATRSAAVASAFPVTTPVPPDATPGSEVPAGGTTAGSSNDVGATPPVGTTPRDDDATPPTEGTGTPQREVDGTTRP
jgi:hypothetical protein